MLGSEISFPFRSWSLWFRRLLRVPEGSCRGEATLGFADRCTQLPEITRQLPSFRKQELARALGTCTDNWRGKRKRRRTTCENYESASPWGSESAALELLLPVENWAFLWRILIGAVGVGAQLCFLPCGVPARLSLGSFVDEVTLVPHAFCRSQLSPWGDEKMLSYIVIIGLAGEWRSSTQ